MLYGMSDLQAKLSMSHVQSDEELRQQLLDQAASTEKEREEANDPETKKDERDKPLYTFPFKYVNRRGETFSGVFTNQILKIADKMNVAVMESQFNGGQPYESIETVQGMVNRGMAWMMFSLVKRLNQSPSGWADNLRALDDEDLVLALFQEVSAHEGYFHGRTTAQARG